MIEGGSRRRNQPAPPHAVFEALTHPDRDPTRSWLHLVGDERRPDLVRVEPPHLVVWSSLWPERPEATIRFDLPVDEQGQGTDLRWTLYLDEPLPEAGLLGHMRKRINQLINANLRYSFGQ